MATIPLFANWVPRTGRLEIDFGNAQGDSVPLGAISAVDVTSDFTGRGSGRNMVFKGTASRHAQILSTLVISRVQLGTVASDNLKRLTYDGSNTDLVDYLGVVLPAFSNFSISVPSAANISLALPILVEYNVLGGFLTVKFSQVLHPDIVGFPCDGWTGRYGDKLLDFTDAVVNLHPVDQSKLIISGIVEGGSDSGDDVLNYDPPGAGNDIRDYTGLSVCGFWLQEITTPVSALQALTAVFANDFSQIDITFDGPLDENFDIDALVSAANFRFVWNLEDYPILEGEGEEILVADNMVSIKLDAAEAGAGGVARAQFTGSEPAFADLAGNPINTFLLTPTVAPS